MADTVNANKTYFNKLASEYDSRFEKTIEQLVDEIQKRRFFISVDWVEDDEEEEEEVDAGDGNADGEGPGDVAQKTDDTSVRLLDYACGTGLISRALAQYTSRCVGIDISENMVAAYNARAENQGLSQDEMHAYQGNLTDPEDPSPAAFTGPAFSDFDVAAVGLGFHHFDDPDYSAKKLVERLRPGGVLFILDFLPHAPAGGLADDHGRGHVHHHHGHGHDDPDNGDEFVEEIHKNAQHTIKHHGFSEERIRAIFEGAGAGKDFALAELGSGVVFTSRKGDKYSMKRRVFLARGVKA